MVTAREMFGTAAHLKRRAEDEAGGEQRITKRLARMRIGQEQHDAATGGGALRDSPDHRLLHPSVKPIGVGDRIYSPDDCMNIDETKDKIYIHDLDSEIAKIEAEEPKGIFLADVERKISAIPQQLLRNQSNNTNTQMVLYQVPSSISVPEGQDHVRKAIIAARTRAREAQAAKATINEQEDGKDVSHVDHVNGLIPDGIGEEQGDYDPDAMELG